MKGRISLVFSALTCALWTVNLTSTPIDDARSFLREAREYRHDALQEFPNRTPRFQLVESYENLCDEYKGDGSEAKLRSALEKLRQEAASRPLREDELLLASEVMNEFLRGSLLCGNVRMNDALAVILPVNLESNTTPDNVSVDDLRNTEPLAEDTRRLETAGAAYEPAMKGVYEALLTPGLESAVREGDGSNPSYPQFVKIDYGPNQADPVDEAFSLDPETVLGETALLAQLIDR